MTAQRHLLISPPYAHFFKYHYSSYSNTVFKTGTLPNVFGFIDDTVMGIPRPGGENLLQRVVYNWQKRKHALKYQAVTTPDWFCVHIHGPEVGRRHESFFYTA